MKDKNGKEIKAGDELAFDQPSMFCEHNLFVKYNEPDKYSKGGLVVYDPNCCDTCKNSYGCICDLDECLIETGGMVTVVTKEK